MSAHTVHEAKTHLSRLIEQACAGEEAVIAKDKVPLVRLSPLNARPRGRRFGSLRGQAWVSDVFFEALPEQELGHWKA